MGNLLPMTHVEETITQRNVLVYCICEIFGLFLKVKKAVKQKNYKDYETKRKIK